MRNIFIGTSGWNYEHWRGIFYPQDLPKSRWLEYYCQYFKTVEINTSFYHLPKRKTFENWRKRVESGGSEFVFSVKGSRYITHIKKLKDCQEPLKRFFKSANGLFTSEVEGTHRRRGDTSEVVLWQLPPGWKANIERLRKFVNLLPHDWRHVFEFRDGTWLNKEVLAILEKNAIAVVFQDFEYWPMTEKVTADFVYIRFHGKKELYASCYPKRELEIWAKKIQNWKRDGLDVYGYFNNDMNGYAVKNAQELIDLI